MNCEKLICKWQQVQFQYDFRNDKSSSRKSRDRQPPRAIPMARVATSERIATLGTTQSTPTLTKKGTG